MTASERTPAVPAIGCFAWQVPAIESVLFLAWSARGLTHALWLDAHDSVRPPEIAPQVPELTPPAAYANLLSAYFAGEAVDPASLPVDLSGTPFQLQVWQALRRIARGHVRSYAGIAADIGNLRAMRAVGLANGRNPVAVVVPCHRVIEKTGQLGGYSSGLNRKRFLLALEGVQLSGEQVLAGQLPLL